MTHPVVLAALAVLLLNDHVLKRAWPGTVTGKLSDVAGPIVAAALLGAVARAAAPRRPRLEAASWAAVAVAFALLKAVPALNDLVPLAGVADPADVLGLAAMPFAWRATRRRAPAGFLSRAAATVTAVLAITATSAEPQPHVTRLDVGDGYVRASAVDQYEDERAWESRDGGRTWTEIEPYGDRPPLPEEHVPRPRACSGAHCYDVSDAGLLLRESRDGGRTWRPVLRAPDGWLEFADLEFVDGDTILVAGSAGGILRREGDGLLELVLDVAVDQSLF